MSAAPEEGASPSSPSIRARTESAFSAGACESVMGSSEWVGSSTSEGEAVRPRMSSKIRASARWAGQSQFKKREPERGRTGNAGKNLVLVLLRNLLQLLNRITSTTKQRSVGECVGELANGSDVLAGRGSDNGRKNGWGKLGEVVGGVEEGVEVEELEEEKERGVRVGLREGKCDGQYKRRTR